METLEISNIHNCQAKQCYLPFPQAAAETTSPLSWWNGMFCTLTLNTFYWWGLICQHTDASRKGTNHFYPVLNKELHNGRHKVPFHFRLDELVYRGQMNAVVSASLIGYSAWLETFQREVNDREGKICRIWADFLKLWNQADCWGWRGRDEGR